MPAQVQGIRNVPLQGRCCKYRNNNRRVSYFSNALLQGWRYELPGRLECHGPWVFVDSAIQPCLGKVRPNIYLEKRGAEFQSVCLKYTAPSNQATRYHSSRGPLLLLRALFSFPASTPLVSIIISSIKTNDGRGVDAGLWLHAMVARLQGCRNCGPPTKTRSFMTLWSSSWSLRRWFTST